MGNLTKKEIKKLDDLYEKAVNRYLDKTDFNPTDWLNEKEQKEFNILLQKEEK